MFKSPADRPLTGLPHDPSTQMKITSVRLALMLALGPTLLGGCERLGIPDPAKAQAQAEAEGKAIGSACRHAGRAIEDCYTLNQAAPKAAIFSGWKEMNDYMVENKIAEVAPQLPPPPPPAPPQKTGKKAKDGKGDKDEDHGDKEDAADSDKSSGGHRADEETPRRRRRSAE